MGYALQFDNWGLFFWLPEFLASVEQGGAGMGWWGSLQWIIRCSSEPTSLSPFGFIADRIGTRQAFVFYRWRPRCSARLGQMARSPSFFGARPLRGYFGYGYFSMLEASSPE